MAGPVHWWGGGGGRGLRHVCVCVSKCKRIRSGQSASVADAPLCALCNLLLHLMLQPLAIVCGARCIIREQKLPPCETKTHAKSQLRERERDRDRESCNN
eukprot:COSAG06_NODE_385_length_16466_cov_2.440582_4_plen_100_part_00